MIGMDFVLIAAALLAIGCLFVGEKRRRRYGEGTVSWCWWEELLLMLIFPLAGEVFGSFFLTRSVWVLIAGEVMSLFAVVGAWNRLRIRQVEAGEDVQHAKKMRRTLEIFCVGMGIFLTVLCYWQFCRGILPAFSHQV